MPNNLVFTDVASQMKTQIYGQNGSDIVAIQTDSSGNVIVTGTVTALVETVTAVVSSGTVTALLDTVTAVVSSGTVTALLDTVTAVVSSGTVTALLDTVTAVVSSGTVTALLDTVTAVTSPIFIESNISIAGEANQTVTALTMNNSEHKTYSFYVNNQSSTSITALLQLSPDDTEDNFVDDGSATTIASSNKAVLVAQKFMKYTRLLIGAGGDTATAIVYYNAQT